MVMNDLWDYEVARHPIGVVVERTGLSQDVVRVWERRYGAVTPARGPGGHRLYSDADIARLRLLQAVTRAGRSIGQVASLSPLELERLAAEDASEAAASIATPDDSAEHVDQAFALVLALDGPGVEGLLRRSLTRGGLRSFVDRTALPLLRRIGDGWHRGEVTIAQEHLASGIIQDILLETMRGTGVPADAARLVVATPAGERHSIGAAITGALAAADGWRVIYLGADLPADEIAAAAASVNAAFVAVSMVHTPDRPRLLRELRTLREQVPAGVEVIAGGSGAQLLKRDLSEIGIRVGPVPMPGGG